MPFNVGPMEVSYRARHRADHPRPQAPPRRRPRARQRDPQLPPLAHLRHPRRGIEAERGQAAGWTELRRSGRPRRHTSPPSASRAATLHARPLATQLSPSPMINFEKIANVEVCTSCVARIRARAQSNRLRGKQSAADQAVIRQLMTRNGAKQRRLLPRRGVALVTRAVMTKRVAALTRHRRFLKRLLLRKEERLKRELDGVKRARLALRAVEDELRRRR
jgi:hypothetical protein